MPEKIPIWIKFSWPKFRMAHLEQICEAAHERNYSTPIPLYDAKQKLLFIATVSPDEIVNVVQVFPVDAIVAGEIARPFCEKFGWFGLVEFKDPDAAPAAGD